MTPAFLTYLAMTASPGPGTMAIGAVAARHGRRSGLVFAAGLLAGGASWAVLAALGVSTVLASVSQAMIALKAACAAFLFWLSWRSARAALNGAQNIAPGNAEATPRWHVLARRGFILQISNPKSVLTWIAVMALGVHAGSSPVVPFAVITTCEVLGMAVFAGYAFVFSISAVARGYRRAYRWIEGTLAGLFAAAGIRLLVSPRL
ncbi:LysE family translocator [Amycolatopsis sp. WGS_07]|uniref:LysE family translocator n=1 Tax=Amycolatopsis sp. WGS_07 TaxID=3076764 RepID=UPI0038731CCE